jgi:hypothetical protein
VHHCHLNNTAAWSINPGFTTININNAIAKHTQKQLTWMWSGPKGVVRPRALSGDGNRDVGDAEMIYSWKNLDLSISLCHPHRHFCFECPPPLLLLLLLLLLLPLSLPDVLRSLRHHHS